MSNGTFQLAIPGKTLTDALRRHQPIPNEMVNLTFDVSDVVTHYFEQLPPITGAHGSAHLRGNRFDMTLQGGVVTLPSGKQLTFTKGTMQTVDLARLVSPMTIDVEGAGSARDFLELIDLKPLQLVTESGIEAGKLSGQVRARARFNIQAQRNVSREHVAMAAAVALGNASFPGLVDGVDMTGGQIKFTITETGLDASGPVRLNGVPARLSWSRDRTKNGPGEDVFVVKATLNDAQREKIGINISEFVRGPVKFEATAKIDNNKISGAKISADVSKATLILSAIDWARGPTKGTKAKFDVSHIQGGGKRISNLALTGTKLKVRGNLSVNKNGDLIEASFPTVVLDDLNQFAVVMKNSGGSLSVAATGSSFDARPFINGAFSREQSSNNDSTIPMAIDASIEKVYANRGEVINNVRGRIQTLGGFVQQATLEGKFANGQPVVMKVTPSASGLRDLRVVGKDSGAALRAANLYSKVEGGSIDFHALLGGGGDGTIKRGLLVVRNFEVRNEAALKDIERPKKQGQAGAGPVGNSLKFSKLSIPFSVDRNFVRIGDALVKGVELGASAQGMIRKTDGLMDIGGTIIPAYALNAAIGEFPLLGQLLVGGKGQGVFGLNFALKGTMGQPEFVVNPVSAIAPGFLRRIFDIGGGGVAADGTPAKPRRQKKISRDQ